MSEVKLNSSLCRNLDCPWYPRCIIFCASTHRTIPAPKPHAFSFVVAAVCTSLAPVPSNPFLVCASLPSANAVVLWDVRETERLFTLPLTTLSICVPAITGAAREAMALSLLHSNGGATTAAATTAAAAAAAGPCGYSESESESSPGPPSVGPERPRPGEMSTVIAVAAARRRGPQLLCLLATGNRHGCVDAAKKERKAGCRLFGIVCVGDGDGAGAHSCDKVSAIPLEAGTETEGRAPPAPGLSETQRCQMFSDYLCFRSS